MSIIDKVTNTISHHIKQITIMLAWAIFFIGILVSASSFFVGQDTTQYNRGAWADYSRNPPGFEYVP